MVHCFKWTAFQSPCTRMAAELTPLRMLGMEAWSQFELQVLGRKPTVPWKNCGSGPRLPNGPPGSVWRFPFILSCSELSQGGAANWADFVENIQSHRYCTLQPASRNTNPPYQKCVGYWNSFSFPYAFWITLLIFTQNTNGTFQGIMLNHYIN